MTHSTRTYLPVTYQCTDCGSLVIDQRQHEKWHWSIETSGDVGAPAIRTVSA